MQYNTPIFVVACSARDEGAENNLGFKTNMTSIQVDILNQGLALGECFGFGNGELVKGSSNLTFNKLTGIMPVILGTKKERDHGLNGEYTLAFLDSTNPNTQSLKFIEVECQGKKIKNIVIEPNGSKDEIYSFTVTYPRTYTKNGQQYTTKTQYRVAIGVINGYYNEKEDKIYLEPGKEEQLLDSARIESPKNFKQVQQAQPNNE